MRPWLLCFGLVVLVFIVLNIAVIPEIVRNDDDFVEIRKAAEEIYRRIESGKYVGISMALIEPTGITYHNFGTTHIGGEVIPQETSVYEIGSISKVFTTIMLAEICSRSDMTLDDPINKYLPLNVNAPTWENREITLKHLATHTSGLPRMPNNFFPADMSNPYIDYGEDKLFGFLSEYTLERDIGETVEYSNYGMGLLGYLLCLSQSKTYPVLLRDVIVQPLGMTDTSTELVGGLSLRLVPGHANGVQVAPWDFDTLVGAGGIRSTARDMAKFIAVNMGLGNPVRLNALNPDLFKAMKTTHVAQQSYAAGDMHVGLGWHIRTEKNGNIIWHNGGTGGYRSFAGFRQDGTRGIVLLGNTTESVDDIGFYLLNSQLPMERSKISAAVELRKLLDSSDVANASKQIRQFWKNHQDHYEFDEQQINRLGYRYLQNGKIDEAIIVFVLNSEFFPESANTWDSLGEGYLKQGNKEKAIIAYKQAVKLHPGRESAVAALVALGVADVGIDTIVNKTVLKEYCGVYEIAPNFHMTIFLDGEQLMEQAIGQQPFPIYPMSQTKFYLKVVNAQIEFHRNASGDIDNLTLFQDGQVISGTRSP